jgi:Ca-activated chloride channel family protein
MTRSMLWFLSIGLVACNAGSSPQAWPSSSPAPNVQPAPTADYTTDHTTVMAPAPASVPFVLTSSDPFATFAADVDTASYDIFRRSIMNGILPLATEVRVEEFVNYFSYDYTAPELDSDVPFTVTLSASAHMSDEARTKLLRVGIQGAQPTVKPAANLVFLVDVSGSMAAPNKLPLVKQLLQEALDVLDPTDSVSIVSYAADTRVRLAATPVRERARIAGVIQGLEAGGGTNGASGIDLAYQEAKAGFLDEGINHIVLCTDGDFNLGVTSNDALVALIKQKRQSGVTLTALGFGERNNDAMMERVSDAGNGIYSVLYDADQTTAYAQQRLLSSMLHIAKDMKIQVEFNPEHVYAYRLLGYEDRAVADTQFRNDRVDGGEVGAGHRVTALFELALSRDDLPDAARSLSRGESSATKLESELQPEDLARVKVRWKQPGASTNDAANELDNSLALDDIASAADELDADAQWAMGVARLAEVLRNSPYANRNELPGLRNLLTPLAADHADRRELLALWPQVERLLKVR